MNEQELLDKYSAKTSSFRLDTFVPLRGDTFVHKDAAGNSYELILSSVEQQTRDSDMFDNFTLVLASARNTRFPQGYFLLEHESLGEFPLFLVPTVSRDPDQSSYCVYFSLKKDR